MNATLVVVTGNKNKAAEIGSITGFMVEAVNLEILEIQSLNIEEVAAEKARVAYEALRRPVIVDDTGMSIRALNGLPGALVSWFLDSIGPEGILRLAAGVSDRYAKVGTSVGYADKNGVRTFLGEVEGVLTTEIRGTNGFGYDPIFVPDGYNKTFAEMSAEEKNEISMRRLALDKLKLFLNSELQD